MIIVEPLGGLANRMRVIASGIWLKNKLNTGLEVIWNENYELKCPYDLLFEKDHEFNIKPKTRLQRYIGSSSQAGAGRQLITGIKNYLAGVSYCITEPDFYSLIASGRADIYDIARLNKNLYIQTSQEFGDNLFAFKYFKPAPPVNETINAVVKNFNTATIGVHIRRTDNETAIANSPVELFIEQMNRELSLNNGAIFFLCTDDAAVEETLKEIFGDKIITHQKEISRQSVKGMQDALIDLYCLSKTSRILGSYWSSFSDIAARIGNIPLQILKTGRHL